MRLFSKLARIRSQWTSATVNAHPRSQLRSEQIAAHPGGKVLRCEKPMGSIRLFSGRMRRRAYWGQIASLILKLYAIDACLFLSIAQPRRMTLSVPKKWWKGQRYADLSESQNMFIFWYILKPHTLANNILDHISLERARSYRATVHRIDMRPRREDWILDMKMSIWFDKTNNLKGVKDEKSRK